MKRRVFLKMATGTVLSAPVLFPKLNSVFAQDRSSVCSAFHPDASSMIKTQALYGNKFPVDIITKFEFKDRILTQMVHSVIMGCTGINTIGKAWESLFPKGQLNATTKISIKINTAYGEGAPDKEFNGGWEKKMCPIGPKPPIIDAIVSGLSEMLDGAFPVGNITIYDVHGAGGGPARMAAQGFTPSGSAEEYVIPGTDTNPRTELYNRKDTPEDAPVFKAGSAGNRITQKVIPPLYKSDFTINLASPKVHQAAGISGIIKNTFGCTHDCNQAHSFGIDSGAPGVMQCAPGFYSELNKLVPTLMNIYDAIGITWDGNGPHWGRHTLPNIIAASKDPVALDSYGLQIINTARLQGGLNPLAGYDTGERIDKPMEPWILFPGSYNRDKYINADFLKIAAEDYSLGNTQFDLKKIELSSIDNPGTAFPSSAGILDIIKTGSHWRLILNAGHSGTVNTVDSKILNLNGREVKSFFSRKTRAQTVSLDWDGKGNSGHSVMDGIYCWEIGLNGRRFNRIVQKF